MPPNMPPNVNEPSAVNLSIDALLTLVPIFTRNPDQTNALHHIMLDLGPEVATLNPFLPLVFKPKFHWNWLPDLATHNSKTCLKRQDTAVPTPY